MIELLHWQRSILSFSFRVEWIPHGLLVVMVIASGRGSLSCRKNVLAFLLSLFTCKAMPKKGKGKKKGGKDKKKKDDGPPPPKVSAEEEPLDETSRKFFTIQITDLETRVGRYQERCAELQASHDNLQSKLTQQEEDQGQVIQFLKKKIKEQALSADAVAGELQAVKQAKMEEREQLEAQLALQKDEASQALDKLQDENAVLQLRLDALEEFRLNKERLETEAREREEEIERLKMDKEEVVYNLEKKAVLDRDRLKKEMVSKVNSVAGEFRKVSDLQMVETTKRTIRENVSITQQLTKMSEKTMTLLRENEVLKRKETQMSRRLELLDDSHRQLSNMNASNQKVILMLQEKGRSQEREMQGLRQRATLCAKLEREAQQAMEHASNKTTNSKEHSQNVEAELARVQAQLVKARREMASLTSTITHSSATIQSVLQGSSSEAEHQGKRQELLATLLQLLTISPSSSSSPLTPSSHSHLTPYTPGDLGLVPPSSDQRRPPHNQPIYTNTTSTTRRS